MMSWFRRARACFAMADRLREAKQRVAQTKDRRSAMAVVMAGRSPPAPRQAKNPSLERRTRESRCAPSESMSLRGATRRTLPRRRSVGAALK
jgi:hypothetical protein